MFTAGDIADAKTFDPVTHVCSFDVGYPPDVMEYIMAECFNRSTATFLVSFHSPRKIIEMYGYNVMNIELILTSMAGSSEGHSGIELLEKGNQAVLDWISVVTGENEDASKSRRHARARKESY